MATAEKRDYSLIGPSAQRAAEQGLVAADWYHPDVPRKRMKELMRRRDGAGAARHRDLAGAARRLRRGRRPDLGDVAHRPVLHRLRGALRVGHRLALARDRPRHGVQDRLAQRRPLPGRLVHEHEGADVLALEPCSPPHRHDHRRARPRDRGDAAARRGQAGRQRHRAARRLGHLDQRRAPRGGRLTEEERTFIPEGERFRVYREARAWVAIYVAWWRWPSSCARSCR